MFLRRVILQSRSDGESPLIQSKVLELEQLLQTMPIAGELPIEEECPACKSEIPFRDTRTAACQNGHPWSECLDVDIPGRFCLPDRGHFSQVLGHHARARDFSGTNVSWVYAQGVFPCPFGFGGSPIHDRREPDGGWGLTSRNPMSILWKSVRILTLAFFCLSFAPQFSTFVCAILTRL